MIIKIDKGTLLSGQPINPSWYKGYIKKVGPHKIEGDRVDLVIELGFEDPILAGDDRSVQHTFYNALAKKGVGYLVPLIGAIKNMPIKTIADGLEKDQSIDFDIDTIGGEKIMFKLINEPYQGRMLNKIEAFLPYNAEIPLG